MDERAHDGPKLRAPADPARAQRQANGNRQPTVYVAQARVGDAPQFSFVAVVTRTVYEHAGQTPGQRVAYRVRAQRSDHQSDYSSTAVVYDA